MVKYFSMQLKTAIRPEMHHSLSERCLLSRSARKRRRELPAVVAARLLSELA